MDINNSLNYTTAIKVDTQTIKPTLDALVLLVSSASYRFPYPIDDISARVILNEMIRDYVETTAANMKINGQYIGYSLINLFQDTFPSISILVTDTEFIQRFTVLFSSVVGYYQTAIQPAVTDILNHGNVVSKITYNELDTYNVLWVVEGLWYGTAHDQDCDA